MQIRKSLGKESIWFILLVFVELCFSLFLTFTHRIPGGHDTFQYFSLQYYFLNNVVNSGQIPQWIPFMTHGTVANFWYFLQAGLFQNILLNSPPLFKNINFLVFFNLGIFIDKLILLVGVWLLAKRFFSSLFTVFFVTLTSLASSVWVSQIWWNFHLYYVLPLILYLLHTFLDKKRWIYLFLAGGLLAIQTLGNLFYFLPVTTLVIFLYFLFYSIFNFKEVVQDIKNLKWGWVPFVSFFSIIFLLILIYLGLKIGTDQLIKYNPGRNLDGTVSLETFLYYAGNSGLAKWMELFSGISPILDYTLYLGIICPALIILGLIVNPRKRYLHFFLLLITLLFFSGGTLLSVFFYYTWPFMKFFRHLSLVSPLIRLFLCFLGGVGLEAISRRERWKNLSSISLLILALLTLGVSGILFYLSSDPWLVKTLIRKTIDCGYSFINPLTKEIFVIKSGLAPLIKLFHPHILILRISRTAIFGLILSVLLGSIAFVRLKKYKLLFLSFLLFFHFLDIYSYKFLEVSLRSKMLTDKQYRITNFQDIFYSKRRSLYFLENNPRASILIAPKRFLNGNIRYEIGLYGSLYWTNQAFLFKDSLNSPFRTESWLISLDNLMRVYWGSPLHNFSIKPKGLSLYGGLKFPLTHPAVLKITGVEKDKIQFFSSAYALSSDMEIGSKITAPEYKGDILFLSPSQVDTQIPRWSKDKSLSSNERLYLSYEILKFDSNNLILTVDNPSKESIWLFYSDVWHPFWKAKVNGENTEVFKANLAYKAIRLKPGLNKVHFYFNSPILSFIQKFFGLSALFWVGFVVLLTIKISTGCLR
ncbi:MAG TPA: hypothetical protein ENI31_07795 [Candidatus Omnitrophica bacterium]|nr:hypothetical protein [Candidatus Omnitrophota bacterium]